MSAQMLPIPEPIRVGLIGDYYDYAAPLPSELVQLAAEREASGALIDLERLARAASTPEQATELHLAAETIMARAARVSKIALDRSEAIQEVRQAYAV
jgi:hypothetical protein